MSFTISSNNLIISSFSSNTSPLKAGKSSKADKSDFLERLKLLAKEKKKSINQVEIDLGFSKNTLYNTKKYTPQGDKLAKLADYFEVSTDYLLEKTDIKTPKKEPVDLEELTSDDGINWDEWLSFGGKPISEHDKNKIKEIFGDRLKD